MVGGRSVPLIPSIVERVRSGPEQSRARRFLARRSVPLTARTDAKQSREEGKSPLPILLTHYRPRIPLNMGWPFGKRVDFNAGYSFTAPTGRYTAGASNNVGSGYWGNDITSGTTLYITKNKGTTANLATDWEIHGQRTVASVPAGQTSKITPGQAFTIEWGLGQVLPLKKDMSLLAQLGVVGYDQWQVSSNSGNYLVAGIPVAARRLPYYSVHGIGVQANFILPAKNVVASFKYYD